MSPDEDLATIAHAELFDDARVLYNHLQRVSSVYTTRLHALVIAWLAEVPNLSILTYDPKITHFLERVQYLSPKETKAIIELHLENICEYLYSPRPSGAKPVSKDPAAA